MNVSFLFHRISLIFKIRSAKRVKVDDFGLFQRLVPIVLLYVVYLVIWTVAEQPGIFVYETRNGLKATTCTEDWWNHSLLISKYFSRLFLVPFVIQSKLFKRKFSGTTFFNGLK